MNVIKYFLILMYFFLSVGCSTTPTPSSEAIPTPKERVFAFQDKSADKTSVLIVTRDQGFVGGGCLRDSSGPRTRGRKWRPAIHQRRGHIHIASCKSRFTHGEEPGLSRGVAANLGVAVIAEGRNLHSAYCR